MGEAVEHFSYDPVGNRTTDAKTGTNAWSYNKNNELQNFDTTSFKYNLNGQMTEKTFNGQKTTYTYNLDSRLSEIRDNSNQVVAQYQYDPFGRRISKALPKESKIIYFHYSKEGLIGEYNESGDLIQSYGYKPNSQFTTDPVFTQRPDFITKAKGGYVYYINDHLATPQKLITETGRKVWEANADVFGKTIITNNEFRNPLRFPGQYKDDESSLRYNFFRYYDYQLGRYVTSDPIGLKGGINNFSYVGGNPINWSDFRGLKKNSECLQSAMDWFNECKKGVNDAYDYMTDRIERTVSICQKQCDAIKDRTAKIACKRACDRSFDPARYLVFVEWGLALGACAYTYNALVVACEEGECE